MSCSVRLIISHLKRLSGEDAILGLPETGLAIIPGYVLNISRQHLI